MERNETLLMLCESCINTLKNTLEADGLPTSVSMTLRQKLFLLETGLEELRNISASGQSASASEVLQADTAVTESDCKANSTQVMPHSDLQSQYLQKSGGSLKDAVTEFEKDLIIKAIEENGSKRKAAAALKTDHSTLIKKCQRYGI
ncbi:MAG: helix-turn-helix domain-containing protein [Anaerovoracaceae bacterium]